MYGESNAKLWYCTEEEVNLDEDAAVLEIIKNLV